jgi:hypothetical protein
LEVQELFQLRKEGLRSRRNWAERKEANQCERKRKKQKSCKQNQLEIKGSLGSGPNKIEDKEIFKK